MRLADDLHYKIIEPDLILFQDAIHFYLARLEITQTIDEYKTVNIKSCSASAIMLTISPNFKYSMFVQERISCKICHIKKKVDVNLPVIPCSHPIMFCKQNILRPTQAIRGLANWKYVSMIFQQMPFIFSNNAHERMSIACQHFHGGRMGFQKYQVSMRAYTFLLLVL